MKTRIVLTAVMAIALLASGLPRISVADNPNIDCPDGTVLVAKFNWQGSAYVFEKGYLGVVTVTGDAKEGTWVSVIGITDVIIKGGQDTHTYSYTYAYPVGVREGAFSYLDLVRQDGSHPTISNIQFCTPATAITLVSFTVQANAGLVSVAWETGTEVDNAGFNLYRATSVAGPWIRINAGLIVAKGDAVSGASYSFADRPGYGSFHYLLEDVDYYGASTNHGPVEVTLALPFRSPLHRPIVPRFD